MGIILGKDWNISSINLFYLWHRLRNYVRILMVTCYIITISRYKLIILIYIIRFYYLIIIFIYVLRSRLYIILILNFIFICFIWKWFISLNQFLIYKLIFTIIHIWSFAKLSCHSDLIIFSIRLIKIINENRCLLLYHRIIFIKNILSALFRYNLTII